MRGEMTHPDTDVLAEFRAGLITGRRSARIAAHLAGCDRCAVLGDKLAAVTALLAAVPAPVMPKSVAQRLEVALAEEVAKKDDPERSGSGSPRAPGAYEHSARNRGFRLVALRVLAPAATAVLLAAGGYGLSHVGGPPNSASSVSRSAPEAARGAANPKIKTRFSPAHRSYPSCTPPGSRAASSSAIGHPQPNTPGTTASAQYKPHTPSAHARSTTAPVRAGTVCPWRAPVPGP